MNPNNDSTAATTSRISVIWLIRMSFCSHFKPTTLWSTPISDSTNARIRVISLLSPLGSCDIVPPQPKVRPAVAVAGRKVVYSIGSWVLLETYRSSTGNLLYTWRKAAGSLVRQRVHVSAKRIPKTDCAAFISRKTLVQGTEASVPDSPCTFTLGPR